MSLTTHAQPCACDTRWKEQIEPKISPPRPGRGLGDALTYWWPTTYRDKVLDGGIPLARPGGSG